MLACNPIPLRELIDEAAGRWLSVQDFTKCTVESDRDRASDDLDDSSVMLGEQPILETTASTWTTTILEMDTYITFAECILFLEEEAPEAAALLRSGLNN